MSSVIGIDLLLVFVVSTAVAIIFDRMKMPTILGFLSAGVIIGPECLGWMDDSKRIHTLAEIGILFLMLTIGLEFSLDRLNKLKKIAFLGGSSQLLISIAIGLSLSHFLGWPLKQGWVVGAVIALSSTAVIFKQLLDRGELETSHGRIAVAILLFQDLAFIPLIVITDQIGRVGGDFGVDLFMAAAKAVAYVVVAILLSKLVLIKLVNWVAETKNREIFHLTILLIGFGSAWLSSQLGLSMAVGAFFAGLMFANTHYGHQISGDIVPFRHVFVSVFFVSVGMILDPLYLIQNIPAISIAVSGVLLVNIIVTFIVVVGFGHPPRVALITSLLIAQIGEFSFLLLESARSSGAITEYYYQLFICTAFITIFLTPFLFNSIPLIRFISERLPFFGMPPQEYSRVKKKFKSSKARILICGYGRVGQDLSDALLARKVPFRVIEMNRSNIKHAQDKNIDFIFGDASNHTVLNKAGIKHAEFIVLSFTDAVGVMHLIKVIQDLNPNISLIARTRFEKDVVKLYEMGVDMVAMEELEASLEVNRLMLEAIGSTREQVKSHLDQIRARKELAIEKAIFSNVTGLDESNPKS